jgi:hypothetical protein
VDIQRFLDVLYILGSLIGEGLPMETVAADVIIYIFRLGMHWSVQVSSVYLERELRKCVRYEWESFRPFVPFHPIQNNMELHINTREDNDA